MPVLETPRLQMVALQRHHLHYLLEDIPALEAELGIQYLNQTHSEILKRALRIKQDKMAHASEALHPWYTYWLALTRDPRLGIGLIGFKGSPDEAGAVEIGYGMHPSMQNRGYATEAASALISWAFHQPGLRFVQAEVLKENIPSRRVMEKCGGVITSEIKEMLYWSIRYNLRSATPADLVYLPDIERSAGELFKSVNLPMVANQPPRNPQQWMDYQRNGLLWVVVDAAEFPVGFAAARVLDGDILHLDELDVHPRHARRKLGTSLVNSLRMSIITGQYSALTLSTFQDIPWNAPFYEHLGFRSLAPQELTPALREIQASEALLGLPMNQRVLMIYTT